MNRVVAAVIILILCISVAVTGYLAVVNSVSEVLDILVEERDAAVANGGFTHNSTERIEKAWKQRETLLVSALPHNELEEIELGIMNLYDYEKQNLPEEYIKTLNACASRLEHILETEKPSLKNIF